MRGGLTATAMAMMLAVAFASPAIGITNGQPDGDDHPYVGLVVSFDAQDRPRVCSGSLIASTLVLTAGHCTVGTVASIFILKKKVTIGDPSGSVPGTPYTHPGFDPGKGKTPDPHYTRDYGMVVLASSVTGVPFAQLPTAKLVDTLKPKHAIDLVGYGVWEQAKVPGNVLPKPPPFYRWTVGVEELQRMRSRSELVPGKFRDGANVIGVTMNPAQGKGGSCWGDSGSPILSGGSDTILAVTSYGTNYNCTGVGFGSRVDKTAVLEWIAGFTDP